MYQPLQFDRDFTTTTTNSFPEKNHFLVSGFVLLLVFFIIVIYLLALYVEDLKWLPLRQAEVVKFLPNRHKVTKYGLHGDILKNVIPNSVEPSSLYTFDETKKTSYGILKGTTDWRNDDIELGKLGDILSAYVSHALHNPDLASGQKALKCFEVFLVDLNGTLVTKNAPWGSSGNTFVFVAVLPRLLAWYMLIPKASHCDIAANLILKLIQNPQRGVNLEQNDIVSVFMAGPYIIAKRFKKANMKEVMNSKEVNYVRKHCLDLDFRTKQGADGLHHDYGFFYYNGVASYSFLYAMSTSMSGYLFYLDHTLKYPPHLLMRIIKKKIFHPTIAATAPLFGITADLRGPTEPNAKLGIEVIPSMRYIRFFHQDYSFAVRGQSNWIPFYESTKARPNMANYWVQFRGVNHSGTRFGLKWPEVGFIQEAARSGDGSHVSLSPMQNLFRTAFKVEAAHSFVAKHGNFGVMYSYHKIPQLGDYEVWELIEMDGDLMTIKITAHIKNNSLEKSLNYFTYKDNSKLTESDKITKQIISKNTSSTITTTCYLLTNNVTVTNEITNANPLDSVNLDMKAGVYKTKLAKSKTHDAVILYKNDKPMVLAFRNQPKFERSYSIGGHKFKFDRKENQYVIQ